MSNLYQDAILDAKALRASAMANAKAALEEAFEPKIQEMIAKHLSEEEEADTEEGYGMEEEGEMHGKDADIEEKELDEILNQLEEMSSKEDEKTLKEAEAGQERAEMEEGKNKPAFVIPTPGAYDVEEEAEYFQSLLDKAGVIARVKANRFGEEAEVYTDDEKKARKVIEKNGYQIGWTEDNQLKEAEEEEAGEEEAEAGEDVDDETKIVDITLGDLKQVIQSLMAGQEEMSAEEPAEEEAPEGEESEEGGEGEEGGEAESEEEVSLDEILDELEVEGAENVGEYDAHDVHHGDVQGDETFARGDKDPMKELHFQSFVKTPGQKDNTKNEGKHAKHVKEEGKKLHKKEEGKMTKELKEARATINTLRKDLQEVNLLNAKYLYMNKLFKGKTLSESQKLKVINTLDRATTVKEVKRAYEIMNESLQVKKSQLKESIGFASKPAGVAPKANIVESEQFINRWQKLAGIK